MRTYAELVKEAIRAAYEKSENEYKKFEVGRTYATRSVCNSECIFKITIIKRTEKTVTIDEGNGKTKRCKIYTDMRNAEAIYPYGIYSMCPIIDASLRNILYNIIVAREQQEGVIRKWIMKK